MVTFKEQILADLPMFFNVGEFADSGLYTSHDGEIEDRPVVVIIDYTDDLAAYRAANSQAAFANMEVQRAQVPDPKRYDKFKINSIVWQVEAIVRAEPETITLRLTTDQRMG